jgi:hypothetical protein
MQKSFLTALIAEGDGSPSTMRAATLLIVGIVMGVWAWTSIKAGAPQPLSTEQVGAVLGALGIKAWQRGKEESPILPVSSEPTK